MSDYIDDELDIMSERCRDPKSFDTETLQNPLAILCRFPAKTADVSANIGEVVRIMQEKNFGAIPITEKGKLAGIVTERDILLKVVGKLDDLDHHSITEIMHPKPSYLHKEDSIAQAMNKMHLGGFRHISIVDEEMRPIHLISIKDIDGYLVDHFPDEILHLPSNPSRGECPREGG